MRGAVALDLDALLDALETATSDQRRRFGRVVAPFVVAELTAALRPSADHSTRKGCGPVGVGDRAWKALADDMLSARWPGVVRRGRWVVVPQKALEAWESRNSAPTPPAPSPRAASGWTPEQSIAEVVGAGHARRAGAVSR